LALVVGDRYLQYADRREAGNMVAYIDHEQRLKRLQLREEHKDKPALFDCIVRKEYKMGGTHGLKGAKLDDVLEVLEERVGPNGHYNLCRRRDADTGEVLSVGWYPIAYLEKVDSRSKANSGSFGWRFWKRRSQ